MTNEPITRTLRIKRPQRGIMIDGTYQVTAYWGQHPPMTTRTIIVRGGVAYSDFFEDELDLSTQGWLRDHHIPCYCPFPRRTDIS